MAAAIILLVVLVVLALWVVGAYNSLIGLKNQVANAWKQIDVQLKRRHDLIPNLVNTVKGPWISSGPRSRRSSRRATRR